MGKIIKIETCMWPECQIERKKIPPLYAPPGISFYVPSPIYIKKDGSITLTCAHEINLLRFNKNINRFEKTGPKIKVGRPIGRKKYCGIHGLNCPDLSSEARALFSFEVDFGIRK